MFIVTQWIAMALAFPDVCKVPTPAGPIPTPFANLAMSLMQIPNNFKHFIMAGPVHNLLTQGTLSNGDEAGAATGLVSNTFIGPKRYLFGSIKLILGVAPAARMTSLTGQNGAIPNMVGASLVPSQPKSAAIG